MLKKKLVEKVLDKALSNGADFSEIFVENTYKSNISYNDSKVKNSVVGKDSGAGVRVFYGNKAIYAFTNDLSEEALMKAADAVSKASKSNEIIERIDLRKIDYKNIHDFKISPLDAAKQEKIEFIRKINENARNQGALISQVSIALMERVQNVMIANSEGVWVEETRPYSRVYATAVASSGNEKQTAGQGPGNLAGYEFIRSLDPVKIGSEIGESAIKILKADYAPSGKFPVVIDNGFGGVIFHEACGHSLETTSVAKGASVFADKLGKQIANPVVTAIDDGTLKNRWGSENYDDEGTKTQKTVLIKDGILKSFMIDKLGGKKIGMKSTGSGRRQNYKFAPTSRMRNTYIAPGKSKLEELISSIEHGIYAKKMGGGSVQPGTGDFNFSVAEGYMIKNGKIEKPIRGATLIGNGANILHNISMVADNLKLAEGMCGSKSGSVPTTVGQPAIKVDEITVGGRKER